MTQCAEERPVTHNKMVNVVRCDGPGCANLYEPPNQPDWNATYPILTTISLHPTPPPPPPPPAGWRRERATQPDGMAGTSRDFCSLACHIAQLLSDAHEDAARNHATSMNVVTNFGEHLNIDKEHVWLLTADGHVKSARCPQRNKNVDSTY